MSYVTVTPEQAQRCLAKLETYEADAQWAAKSQTRPSVITIPVEEFFTILAFAKQAAEDRT